MSTSMHFLSAGCNENGTLCREGKGIEPALVKNLNPTNLVGISIQCSQCCAVYTDGSVYGWGLNKDGKLGLPYDANDEKTMNITTPVKIGGLPPIRAVRCFLSWTIFLSHDGEVIVATGLKNQPFRKVPLKTKCTAIFGYCEPWIVCDDGTIFSLNDDLPADAPFELTKYAAPKNVKAKEIKEILSLTETKVTVLLTVNGDVYGMGEVTGTKTFVIIKEWKNIKFLKISGLKNHFVALAETGKVYVWGKNNHGQLSIGLSADDSDDSDDDEPDFHVIGGSFTDSKIVDVSAGNWYTMFVDAAGNAWGAGYGVEGRTFFGDEKERDSPKKIALKEKAVAVACGNCYSYIQIGGKSCFNNFPEFELSNTSSSSKADPVSQKSTVVTNVECMVSGGYNTHGELGRVSEDYMNPHLVTELNVNGLVSVSVGGMHCVALYEDGTVFGWGFNDNGVIGIPYDKEDETSINIKAPRLIDGLPPISQIKCGAYYTLFLSISNDLFIATNEENRKDIIEKISTKKKCISLFGYNRPYIVCEDDSIFQILNYNTAKKELNPLTLPKTAKSTKVKEILSLMRVSKCVVLNDAGEVFNLDDDLKFRKISRFDDIKIVKICGFRCHILALSEDGIVYSWGKNECGQLGVGDQNERPLDFERLKTKKYSNSKIIDISAGKKFSFFINQDGEIFAAGSGKHGRTLLGDEYDRVTPTKLSITEKAIAVSCGFHSTYIQIKGSPIFNDSPTRSKIVTMPDNNARMLSVGFNESGQICRDGNYLNPLPINKINLNNLVEVTTRGSHSVALYSDGTVFGWGVNSDGVIGLPFDDDDDSTIEIRHPQRIRGLPPIIKVKTGFYFTLFQSIDNDVFIATNNKDRKELIEKIPLKGKCQSIYGGSYPWIVGEDNSLYKVFRYQEDIRDIMRYDLPKTAKSKGIKDIISLQDVSSDIAVTLSGEIFGLGKVTNESKEFVEIESLRNQRILKVSGIKNHIVALTEDGKVFVWGANKLGQLGLGNNQDQFGGFVEIQKFSNSIIVDISAGNWYSIFVDSDGNIYATGYGKDGRTFCKDEQNKISPERVNFCERAKAVLCGSNFTFVQVGGSPIFDNIPIHCLEAPIGFQVYSAGYNDYNALCRGGDSTVLSPATNLSPKNLVSIHTASSHCCALYNDGAVFGWGYNDGGQIGLPLDKAQKDPKNIKSPTQIKGIPPIAKVKCGTSFTLFQSKDNDVFIATDNQNREDLIEKIPLKGKCQSIYGGNYPWIVCEDNTLYKVVKYQEAKKELTKYELPKTAKSKGIKDIISLQDVSSDIAVTLSGEIFGLGKVTNESKEFVEIESLRNQRILKVSGIKNHIVALTEDGKVFVWGANKSGQLGLGNKEDQFGGFVEIKNFSNFKIVDISAGNWYSIFVDSDGNIYATGNGNDGRTLFGDEQLRKLPEKVIFKEKATAVLCGSNFTFVQVGGPSIFENHSDQLSDSTPKVEKEVKPLVISKENQLISENKELIEEIQKLKQIISEKESKINELECFDVQTLKSFKKKASIVRGSSAEIIKVTRNESYAMKIFDPEVIDSNQFKQLIREYEVLSNQNHRNIIKVFGYSFKGGNLFQDTEGNAYNPILLLEYCPKNLKKEELSKMNNIEKILAIYQIVDAMVCIHSNNITHRDLRPDNILIDSKGRIKITSFGISKFMTLETQTQSSGSTKFMAPELLKEEEHYSEKVDNYSFGVLLYFILTDGEYPKISILDVGNGKKAAIPSTINSFSKDIIEKCWSFTAKDRPSFAEIKAEIIKNNYELIDLTSEEKRNIKVNIGLM